jgi:RimJ/RimL family protein N-acetyltransferase
MHLRFKEIDATDVGRLAAWMPSQTWPYHAPVDVDASWVHERATKGYFFGDDVRSFWALADVDKIAGTVRVFELHDVTPLIDIRIDGEFRNKGAGTVCLRWVVDFVFESCPHLHRLGGYTRHDNVPMRRVFEKCHFVQEACHRQAWRIDGGKFSDAIGYGILRSDWSSGRGTAALST